jgi:hypothetical protein
MHCKLNNDERNLNIILDTSFTVTFSNNYKAYKKITYLQSFDKYCHKNDKIFTCEKT